MITGSIVNKCESSAAASTQPGEPTANAPPPPRSSTYRLLPNMLASLSSTYEGRCEPFYVLSLTLIALVHQLTLTHKKKSSN